ncbi:MAG: hypothetical protein FIA95_10655 [Gemmatimonadetes bacterium]|nr:hypothetical protein [Gemmatimonadota bacterium]
MRLFALPFPARLVATALVAAAPACGSPGPGEPSDGTGAGDDPCKVVVGGQGQPVTDPSGPYYHNVVAAETADGLTLTGARAVLEHASVPDGVRLADGTIHIYYVNGAQGYVWIARLEGTTAVPLGPLRLGGTARAAGVVDPDAWRMPDGTIRLAYLSGFSAPSGSRRRAICIAESRDGLSFTVVATALEIAEGELLTDPSVVQLPDGTWRMAISLGQRTVMARSTDGLSFTRSGTLTYGGVPELAIAPDGALRLYVCAAGITAWRSADGGGSWTQEGVVVPPGPAGQRIVCDPSLVAGARTFLYKTAP